MQLQRCQINQPLLILSNSPLAAARLPVWRVHKFCPHACMHFRHSELLSRRASCDVSRFVPPCLCIYTWPRDGRDLDMNTSCLVSCVLSDLFRSPYLLFGSNYGTLAAAFLTIPSLMTIKIDLCNYFYACTTRRYLVEHSRLYEKRIIHSSCTPPL